jgi:hypothetical protein
MAGNVTGQTPDPGCRCSISKAKDAARYGRYARYGKMLAVVPPGLRTIHSDAWRDVGASWEPEPTGFVDHANEQFCGCRGDSEFWRGVGAGVSMGVEGNDGQAAEFMGTCVTAASAVAAGGAPRPPSPPSAPLSSRQALLYVPFRVRLGQHDMGAYRDWVELRVGLGRVLQ